VNLNEQIKEINNIVENLRQKLLELQEPEKSLLAEHISMEFIKHYNEAYMYCADGWHSYNDFPNYKFIEEDRF
jgi:hypothetical protein